MTPTNRIAPVAAPPTPEEIEDECRMIRQQWSKIVKKRRAVTFRSDNADHQYNAHLRFLKFLAQYEETEA